MPTRRAFCLSIGALVAAGPLARVTRGHQLPETFTATLLKPGIWLVEGLGGNSIVLTSDDGPILVDTKLVMHGERLVEQVALTGGAPPALVINTHHHGDHTGGNWAVRRTAPIYGHEKMTRHIPATMDRYRRGMQRHMTRLRAAGASDETIAAAGRLREWIDAVRSDVFQPTSTVGDDHEMDFGGRRLHLRHFGPGHTDNDLLVHLPRHDVLHAGDLLFNRLHPFVDVEAGADTRRWEAALDRAIGLCTEKTIVIGGHGPPGDRAALAEQREYLRVLRRLVREAMDAGATRADVIRMRPEAYTAYGYRQSLPRALGAIHDELDRDRTTDGPSR